jgi:hypothetical protein
MRCRWYSMSNGSVSVWTPAIALRSPCACTPPPPHSRFVPARTCTPPPCLHAPPCLRFARPRRARSARASPAPLDSAWGLLAPPPSSAPAWRRPSNYCRWLWHVGPIATCATPDLLLKHLDAAFETYVWKQMKYMKHVSETLIKTPENTWKPLQNIHNIEIKYLQYMCETYATSR